MQINLQTGRISSDFGSHLEVLLPDGTKTRLSQFTHLERPHVGDLVKFEGDRLLAIEPSKNQLSRLKSNGEIQVLAANLDEVWLCIPLDREPSLGRVERFSHFALSQGFKPLLLLTKSDICENPQAWVSLGISAGLEVVLCSPLKGIGLEELAERLTNQKTILLLGQSGVGKTTLANYLAGTDFTTQNVRALDHRGQHTTVSRNLIPTKNGGYLLDIPGLRDLSWEEQDQIPEAWSELASSCRFSNCAHQGDEGCGLAQGVKDGVISQESLDHWRKMQKESAYQTRRQDKTESGNSKKRMKKISLQIRSLNKIKDF